MKNFYLILIILILILFFHKRNIENMEIDNRIFNDLKCKFGWESGRTGSTMRYTGLLSENEFIGAPLGLDVLSACECDDIFVGEKKKVNPCKPPKCMRKLRYYLGECGDEKKKKIKKKIIILDPTEFGSVNETNLVRAFIKYINDISDDLMYIKGNEESELKYDDFLLAVVGIDDLLRPEKKSLENLKKKIKLYKEEESNKEEVE
jgi:hypothetical protein